jgi:hypothetical protein
MGRWTVLFLGLHLAAPSWASTPFKQSLDVKKNAYMTDGVFTGGKSSAQGVSLLAVRHVFSAKAQLERVIVALGDKESKPLKEDVGFFQASMDAGSRRAVLDISQLKQSRVSEAQVQQLFKKSPYVRSVDFTLDPEDKAATMVINFKQPMRMEVFHLRKPARIVMDLKPLPAGRL